MKTQDDVIQVLGGLSDRDRAWIIERLSPQSRTALLNGTTAGAAPSISSTKTAVATTSTSTGGTAVASKAQASGGADLVALADAEQIAAVLQHEPAWVAHALLSRPWPWSDEIRDRLPSLLQSELRSLDSSSHSYSAKLVGSVIDKVAGMISSVVVVSKPSRFETLVASLGVKMARKRMGLRA